MEIYLFVIISMIILFAITKYMQHTTEQSLSKRWKFVKFMQPILKSDEYTPEFKKLILSMFNDSMQKNLLPKLIIFSLFLFIKKEYKPLQAEFENKILQNDKNQHKQYKKAIMLMMEINLYNAPHWYIIVGFLPILAIMIFSIFAKANKLITETFLETLIFRTVKPQYQTY